MRVCLFGDARCVHVQRIARGLAGRGLTVRLVTDAPDAAMIDGVTVEQYAIPPARAAAFTPRVALAGSTVIPRGNAPDESDGSDRASRTRGVNAAARGQRWSRRRDRYLLSLLESHDAAHILFLRNWDFTPTILRRAGNVVVSPWGSDIVPPPDTPPRSPSGIRRQRSLLRAAAEVCVWGPTFAETTARFGGIDVNRITTVPLGVDLDRFRLNVGDDGQDRRREDARRERRGSGGTFTVGYLKGFRPVYGPATLIEAIAVVAGRLPNVTFELAGDGPMLDDCRCLADRLGVADRIRWLGRVAHDELPAVMGRWDLSVVSSVYESFCLAALESAAMEVPVVAFRVGGLVETVIDGETGLLTAPGDPAALAGGIVDLLTDADRRRRMGLAGRRMVADQYPWEKSLDGWIAVYERVASRRRRVRWRRAAAQAVGA